MGRFVKIKADLTKKCKAKLWTTSNHTSGTSFEQSAETFLSIYKANKEKMATIDGREPTDFHESISEPGIMGLAFPSFNL